MNKNEQKIELSAEESIREEIELLDSNGTKQLIAGFVISLALMFGVWG